MKWCFVFLVIFLSFVLLEAQVNYCNKELCRDGKKHIACNNDGSYSPQCAVKPRMMTITPAIKKNIINRHNRLRGRVARGGFFGFPGAVRMATMQWDNELANMAQLNVKQCAMKHDECRNTYRFRYAGQNLAKTRYFGVKLTVNEIAMQHINLWFDEYKNATTAMLQSYPKNPPEGKVIGHFTQMMQEKANRIGCAILRQNEGKYIYQFMACNYAYSNVFNRPVYRSGKTGSQCTSGRNRVLRSLCSTNERYNVNVLT